MFSLAGDREAALRPDETSTGMAAEGGVPKAADLIEAELRAGVRG